MSQASEKFLTPPVCGYMKMNMRISMTVLVYQHCFASLLLFL